MTPATRNPPHRPSGAEAISLSQAGAGAAGPHSNLARVPSESHTFFMPRQLRALKLMRFHNPSSSVRVRRRGLRFRSVAKTRNETAQTD